MSPTPSQAPDGNGDQTGLTQINSAKGKCCIYDTITLALHQAVLQWQKTVDVHRVGSTSRVVKEFLLLLDTASERFHLLSQSAKPQGTTPQWEALDLGKNVI